MNLSKLLLIVLAFFTIKNVASQDRPALVVGIVVDQMTNDYLYRFNAHFGNDGFNRLISGGYYFPNTFYNYMSTSTGPGHASIYTGTTPALHGIMENRWYDRKSGEHIYCVSGDNSDDLNDGKKGSKSPSRMIGSTITDMLSLSSLGNSKTIGIGIKDRSAILPAGHSADLALWYDDDSGKWTTGKYYVENPPNWMRDFEEAHPVESYLKEWQFSYKVEQVSNYNYPEHNEFEAGFGLDEGASMPYNLKSIAEKNGTSIIKSTPFGNTYTFDLAEAVIKGEKMGKRFPTDFLCISFSSTDYIGHRFGPYSREVEDTYIRFDRELANFLLFLDENIGRNEYLLFFTSDHGVVPNIDYLKSQKIPGSHYNLQTLKEDLNTHLLDVYKTNDLVLFVTEGQVYLDQEKISSSKIELKKVLRTTTDYLNENDDIMAALSSQDFLYKNYEDFPRKEMQNSYYHGRSGDVLYVWRPFMRSDAHKKGTGHGSPYVYDRNVPLIWYGKGIKNGFSTEGVEITQIAATLADLLQVQRPALCTAESLVEKIKK